MTFKIPKSAVAGRDFVKEVEAHAEELSAWARHMDEVRASPKTHQAYPAPDAPADVAAAIRQTVKDDGGVLFVPDFDVEDDGPTEEQALRARKDELIAAVSTMERAAADSVLPPGKRRLRALRVAEIMGEKEDDRSKEDQRFLADSEEVDERLAAVDRHAAELQDEIEDLTAETVEGWKPKEFPR